MTMVLNESKVLKSAKIKNGVNITFVWPNVKLGGYFDFMLNTITCTSSRGQEEHAHRIWGKFCFHYHLFVSLYRIYIYIFFY